MSDKGMVFAKLLHLAHDQGIIVRMSPDLTGCYGRIYKNRVAIASDMEIDDINYTFAHELAHWYLHKGINVIESPDKEELERQAHAGAQMLLDLLMVMDSMDTTGSTEKESCCPLSV